MVEFEADDAIATAAIRYQDEPGVNQIVIGSPDKDLTQLVSQNHIVCWNWRSDIIYDESEVIKKYGVSPTLIPDYLALVGDSANGIPGIPAWGAKSASALLSKYQHIEDIPDDIEQWGLTMGRARGIADNLIANMDEAILYRRLTTLRLDVPLEEGVDDLEWRGAQDGFGHLFPGGPLAICGILGTHLHGSSMSPQVRR